MTIRYDHRKIAIVHSVTASGDTEVERNKVEDDMRYWGWERTLWLKLESGAWSMNFVRSEIVDGEGEDELEATVQ